MTREPIDVSTLLDDERLCADLRTVGITTVDEALRYFPRRYLQAGTLSNLAMVMEEGADVAFMARVESVTTRQMRQRRGSITTARVSDGSFIVEVPFFNQHWIADKMLPGTEIAISGKVAKQNPKYGSAAHFQIKNPVWLNQIAGDELTFETRSHPIPIYKASNRIATHRIAAAIRTILDTAPDEVFADPLPIQVLSDRQLPDLRSAYAHMHRPDTMEQVEAAQKRWKFEEAFALQAHLLAQKSLWNREVSRELTGRDDGALAYFDEHLAFPLTGAQQRAGAEIAADLAQPHPMNRLLHGDVGSGKTLVALRAMLQAVDSGAQAAMLAPTEVLAAQHYRSLMAMLGPQAEDPSLFSHGRLAHEHTRVRVALLTGSLSTKERKELLLALVAGQIDIIVGTHALVSDTTIFNALGLVVIDEQHRFGVAQREALRRKFSDYAPHALVMTATPIPRTMALTVFGDLETSVLDELPHGPKTIATHAFSLSEHPTWLDRVLTLVAEAAAAGQQTFIVASKIDFDPSQGDPLTAPIGVDELQRRLQNHPAVAHLDMAVVHGRMGMEDKEEVMRAFAAGKLDVLIATTVIEVGIDVPRARIMVIFDAENFGVAQLHQLRGRIGRDGQPATCFLLTHQPSGSEAMERLQTVAETLDGFALAEFDMEKRREGDVLGRTQWGRTSLTHLSVARDKRVIEDARKAAADVVDADPLFEAYPHLRDFIDTIIGPERSFGSTAD